MLASIKKKIQELGTSKQLIGLTAIASGIAISFYLWNKSKKTPQDKKKNPKIKAPTPQSSPIKRKISSEFITTEVESPEKALIKKINAIKQTLASGNKITFQTVIAIYKGQYQLARKEVLSLIVNSRAQRRKQKINIDDFVSLKDYCTLVLNFVESKQNLYKKYLDAILAYFHISFAAWMELTDDYEQKNKDQWQDVLLDTEDEQLLSLRPKDRPKIKYSTLVSIYEYKIQKMEEILDKLRNVDIQLTDKCLAAEKLVEDFVFLKFKYEEQDVRFSEEKLQDNQKTTLKKLQNDFTDLRSTIFGDLDDWQDQQSEKMELKQFILSLPKLQLNSIAKLQKIKSQLQMLTKQIIRSFDQRFTKPLIFNNDNQQIKNKVILQSTQLILIHLSISMLKQLSEKLKLSDYTTPLVLKTQLIGKKSPKKFREQENQQKRNKSPYTVKNYVSDKSRKEVKIKEASFEAQEVNQTTFVRTGKIRLMSAPHKQPKEFIFSVGDTDRQRSNESYFNEKRRSITNYSSLIAYRNSITSSSPYYSPFAAQPRRKFNFEMVKVDKQKLKGQLLADKKIQKYNYKTVIGQALPFRTKKVRQIHIGQDGKVTFEKN